MHDITHKCSIFVLLFGFFEVLVSLIPEPSKFSLGAYPARLH